MGNSIGSSDYFETSSSENSKKLVSNNDIEKKSLINVYINSKDYSDSTFHISPVLGIKNSRIIVKKENGFRYVPIILIGERHDFKPSDNNMYKNTFSILDIIEKYVLYNIRERKYTRIIMHYEASMIKNINIDQYFNPNNGHYLVNRNDLVHRAHSIMEILINVLTSFKYIPNGEDDNIQKNAWYKIDKISSLILSELKYDDNINKCEDLIVRSELVNRIYKHISLLDREISAYLRKYHNIRYNDIYDSVRCIIDKLNSVLKELDKPLIENNKANDYYSKYMGPNLNDASFMSQLNLIYAGGWLKPQFKLNKSTYLPFADMFKCHLKLVQTVTSITDKVEIYNIDYRTIIINNIQEELVKLKYSHTVNHYGQVYDLVINQITLKYLDATGIEKTIDNPIVKLYDELRKMDNYICIIDNKSLDYKYSFKKIFVESLIDNNVAGYIPESLVVTYFWILDLYSMLQLIYMSKQNSLPSMFISVLGDTHRTFQELFLKKWYDIDIRDDKYNNYILSYKTDGVDIVDTKDLPNLSHCIYRDVIFENSGDNILTNDGGKTNYEYLSKTLYYTSRNIVDYRDFKDSLNSYDFFKTYPYDIFRSDEDRSNCFILDIVDNYGKTCGINSLDTYDNDNQQKNNLFKYFESTTDLFKDNDHNLQENDRNLQDQKLTVGGYSSNQGDLLYKIQANFAKYYMDVSGYDDPVKLMVAIKFHLLAIGIGQNYIEPIQHTSDIANSININLPKNITYASERREGEPIKIMTSKQDIPKLTVLDTPEGLITNPMAAAAAGGGTFAHAFRVLLISALIVVLILLLCRVMGSKSNYPYMLENDQSPAYLHSSIPLGTYPYST